MDKMLSKTMLKTLEYIKEHGNVITRYQGGFWAEVGWHPYERPWFNTNTIQALVERGYLSYTQWKESRRYNERFPIEATLTELGIVHCNS